MTSEELNAVKGIIKRLDNALREIWLERVLLQNLILDSDWMSEKELDSAIVIGVRNPQNIQAVEEHFSASDKFLAEIGLDDWLSDFETKYPSKD